LSRSLKVTHYSSIKIKKIMEFSIALNPSQVAAVAQINALLRENGISASILTAKRTHPIAPATVSRVAAPTQQTSPVAKPFSLTSSFVYTEFEPGY
jgi:hypothetical protein